MSRARVIAAAAICAAGCRGDDAARLYFGQTPPDDTPVVFAPAVVSLPDRYEQFLQYSPDGRRLTFGVTNSDWSDFSLREMTIEAGGWTEPVRASFVGSDLGGFTAAESFDGSRVFFASGAPGSQPPSDIYVSDRTAAGWSAPAKVRPPVSSPGNEFEVAIARNGTLYFSSSREGGLGDLDLYRAPRINGGYPRVESLGEGVNSQWGDDLPYIAPDESYLIFASDRPGGMGLRDLYVTFNQNGNWTDPVNLGAPINSAYWDIYPSVSPDGRYLFFTRRQAWQTDEDSDIYWVSAAVIGRLERSVGR